MAEPIRIVCPRVSPQWELAARLALVKPKPFTKAAVTRAKPTQPWPRNAMRVIAAGLATSRQVGTHIEFPERSGDLIVITVHGSLASARRIARKVSRLLPELWFVLEPWYVRAGVFYQRTGKYKLELVRATNVRLRRSIRFGYLGDLHAIAHTRHRAGRNARAESNR